MDLLRDMQEALRHVIGGCAMVFRDHKQHDVVRANALINLVVAFLGAAVTVFYVERPHVVPIVDLCDATAHTRAFIHRTLWSTLLTIPVDITRVNDAGVDMIGVLSKIAGSESPDAAFERARLEFAALGTALILSTAKDFPVIVHVLDHFVPRNELVQFLGSIPIPTDS